MIVLRSADLLVRLDPRHGAEILDLVDLRSGRQLLGRPPFGSREPLAGDLCEEAWTQTYRGGWQLLAPNAGNACLVRGTWHGFHGRASSDPWTVLEVSEGAAALTWRGHGLEIKRRLALEEGTLAVSVRMQATDDSVPVVAAEHVSLGLELIEPEVAIDLPGGRAFELNESEGPADPPSEAPSWPEVLLLDGSVERADRWPIAKVRSRYFAVTALPEGRATIRNPVRGVGLELAWESAWLEHVWIWHEVRTYGGPWRGQAEILVVEPASVPHGLGLATAIEHGQARLLAAGESLDYRLVARPLVSMEAAGG